MTKSQSLSSNHSSAFFKNNTNFQTNLIEAPMILVIIMISRLHSLFNAPDFQENFLRLYSHEICFYGLNHTDDKTPFGF